jgi:hypothetical protein
VKGPFYRQNFSAIFHNLGFSAVPVSKNGKPKILGKKTTAHDPTVATTISVFVDC